MARIERNSVQASAIPDETQYVGLENIESGGTFTEVQAVANGDLSSSKFSFNNNHILYGKLRPYLAKIARPDFDGVCSTDILPILPGPTIDRDYLARLLQQPAMVNLASSRATGANLPRLNPKTLSDFTIAFPQLPEQRRIVAVLDRAEALRAKRREALAQLDELTQSVFLDMFGDITTPSNDFPSVPLSKLCRRITDGTHQSPEWSTHGHPFLFVSNITSGVIDFSTEKFISDATHDILTRRCPIEPGDVLYSTVGSYGVPAVVRTTRKFAFQRHIAHIKPDPDLLESTFLFGMLASQSVRRQADSAARGIAQKTVNLADIKNFMMFHPPFVLQQQFARRVEGVERLKASQRAHLAELDELFASLQQRAFRGELSGDL